MLDASWNVLFLAAFIGLPVMLYLCLSYFYPLWKEAIYGKKPEPEEVEAVESSVA